VKITSFVASRGRSTMRRRLLCRTAAFMLAGLPLMASRAHAADGARNFTFGVVPQQSASELAKAWIPLFNVLSERAGFGLRFATAPSIPIFERRLAAGEYDFAYMNPYHYTVFSQKPGYRAFAREKGRRLRGMVVVRKDSALRELADLARREIAFPAPASFAATVLVRAELERLGIAVTPRFVGSHESVYLNVVRGVFPAGGGIPRTLQAMEPAVRDELRLLWSTKDYTPHALAAHPRVPADAVARLLDAMEGADAGAAGKAALQGVGFNGIEAAKDADWADVRGLGIKTLAELLKS
jgi:phosphonate transport system substrate-binding protein